MHHPTVLALTLVCLGSTVSGASLQFPPPTQESNSPPISTPSSGFWMGGMVNIFETGEMYSLGKMDFQLFRQRVSPPAFIYKSHGNLYSQGVILEGLYQASNGVPVTTSRLSAQNYTWEKVGQTITTSADNEVQTFEMFLGTSSYVGNPSIEIQVGITKSESPEVNFNLLLKGVQWKDDATELVAAYRVRTLSAANIIFDTDISKLQMRKNPGRSDTIDLGTQSLFEAQATASPIPQGEVPGSVPVTTSMVSEAGKTYITTTLARFAAPGILHGLTMRVGDMPTEGELVKFDSAAALQGGSSSLTVTPILANSAGSDLSPRVRGVILLPLLFFTFFFTLFLESMANP